MQFMHTILLHDLKISPSPKSAVLIIYKGTASFMELIQSELFVWVGILFWDNAEANDWNSITFNTLWPSQEESGDVMA